MADILLHAAVEDGTGGAVPDSSLSRKAIGNREQWEIGTLPFLLCFIFHYPLVLLNFLDGPW